MQPVPLSAVPWGVRHPLRGAGQRSPAWGEGCGRSPHHRAGAARLLSKTSSPSTEVALLSRAPSLVLANVTTWVPAQEQLGCSRWGTLCAVGPLGAGAEPLLCHEASSAPRCSRQPLLWLDACSRHVQDFSCSPAHATHNLVLVFRAPIKRVRMHQRLNAEVKQIDSGEDLGNGGSRGMVDKPQTKQELQGR